MREVIREGAARVGVDLAKAGDPGPRGGFRRTVRTSRADQIAASRDLSLIVRRHSRPQMPAVRWLPCALGLRLGATIEVLRFDGQGDL